MHQRVADLSAEKASKDKLQEENESLQRNVRSMKSRQEALAASGGSTSFADMEVKRERDKLFVGGVFFLLGAAVRSNGPS